MSVGKGIGGHHKPFRGASDDWLTPPDLIEVFGPFDLDPCASVDQPWPTAEVMYTEDGLFKPWRGFVWCNPPYGPQTWGWLNKMARHRNGIALLFARTETQGFFESVWSQADAVLFIKGRLFFHEPVTGHRAKHNSGGPSALLAYGDEAVERLSSKPVDGAFIKEWDTWL